MADYERRRPEAKPVEYVQEKPEAKVKMPEAPWVEVYGDFFILETTHGCLVKVDGNVTFMPNATLASFHVLP